MYCSNDLLGRVEPIGQHLAEVDPTQGGID